MNQRKPNTCWSGCAPSTQAALYQRAVEELAEALNRAEGMGRKGVCVNTSIFSCLAAITSASSPGERQMLRARLSRETRCVGRNEREGRFFIGPVLGQIEMHAANEVPGWVPPFQELLQCLSRIGAFGATSRINLLPKRREHLGIQVFPARHRRCGARQSRQRFRRRDCDDAQRCGTCAAVWLRKRT
ncbi:MAG: hypothetical protein ABI145_10615 [Steroidobacteraceae bacterium]